MKSAVLVLGALAACGKADNEQPKPADKPPEVHKPLAKPDDKVPDPQCAAKAKELESWLEQFGVETASYEVDFGYVLPVIDRAPSPVEQKVDVVMIAAKSIQAFDVSEHNHVGNNLATPKLVAEKLAKLHGMAAGPDERDAGPNDQLRVDVDKDATWGSVVGVIDAAQKAGYTDVVFAFTATSKVPQPAGVEPWSTKEEQIKLASDALEAMRKQCKQWGSALFRHTWQKSKTEDAKALAREVAAAFVA